MLPLLQSYSSALWTGETETRVRAGEGRRKGKKRRPSSIPISNPNPNPSRILFQVDLASGRANYGGGGRPTQAGDQVPDPRGCCPSVSKGLSRPSPTPNSSELLVHHRSMQRQTSIVGIRTPLTNQLVGSLFDPATSYLDHSTDRDQNFRPCKFRSCWCLIMLLLLLLCRNF